MAVRDEAHERSDEDIVTDRGVLAHARVAVNHAQVTDRCRAVQLGAPMDVREPMWIGLVSLHHSVTVGSSTEPSPIVACGSIHRFNRRIESTSRLNWATCSSSAATRPGSQCAGPHPPMPP